MKVSNMTFPEHNLTFDTFNEAVYKHSCYSTEPGIIHLLGLWGWFSSD